MALTLGSGGILAELLEDVVTLLLPASTAEIHAALKTLKIAALMDGYRGQTKVDLPALSSSLYNITQFMQHNPEKIMELEINPLFVYQQQICAVDALVYTCLLYTSPSPRDATLSRMPSSA